MLVLLFHLFSLRIPRIAEGRVRDAVVKFESRELISRKSVAELHVVVVFAADERRRLGDAVRERVEFLAVARHPGIGIKLTQALLGTAEHLGGAHCLIVDGLGYMVTVEDVRVRLNKQIGHQVNDVTASEVGTSILVVRFRKPLDEVLKDIPHVDRFYLVG